MSPPAVPMTGDQRHWATAKMALGAIGIVFGDIGTSPLYAFRETFVGPHPLALDPLHVYGVISLIFWSMTLVVTVQYVSILMRADNKGQGGSLALLALISRSTERARWGKVIVILGVFATALFYGDSMITPAISVLSAVEGLTVVNPALEPLVIPIAIGLLVFLFFIQSRGTTKVGAIFGPVMLVYFFTISVLGLIQIVQHPEILLATLNPLNALRFFYTDGWLAFLALGSVVLAVTGAEALYSDMGHFGRKPLSISWLWFVMPALLLNYMGQAALIMNSDAATAAEAIKSPFFMLAPEALRLPLVLLATVATFIASQAVISGAFSVTHQAIQLGFVPRLSTVHTSEQEANQIYIPVINWALMIAVLILVLTFRNSSNLASAYGIAVTGAMLIDTAMLAVLLFSVWKWKPWLSIPLLAIFFIVDGAYFAANLTKVPDGGWFPLLVGVIAFTLLTTWARGRLLMRRRMSEAGMPMEIFVKSAAGSATRVPGTAIFMASQSAGVPHALLHNMKHNKVLHERVVILTVLIEEVPYIDLAERCSVIDLGEGFFRIILRYGFLQETNIPKALDEIEGVCGPKFDMMSTSFFLSRQTLIAAEKPGMMLWREKLFAWMLRNSATAMEFFRLPTNRVVELGSQVEI
ncbi:potassium transporter Kup [Pacificimonas sp. WHA3]|uniref:Probable potassium transport system protein Kup n=1 Tax=Pacificimonas pallii TaxID=2827236 RepID=A0ABS6SBL0_9SPHN|nr:potassium transporter Kup [Pacificimonas pallii]MBV7255615.1 potassium transporter Kup [Pacificimonas pallii]